MAPPSPATSRGRRKLGFEWELDEITITDEQKVPVPSRGVVFKKDQVQLLVDGDHAEFVIDPPVDSLASLKQQLTIIKEELTAILDAGEGGKTYKVPGPIAADDGSAWMKANGKVVVTYKSEGIPHGTLQVSLDRILAELPDLIAKEKGGTETVKAVDDLKPFSDAVRGFSAVVAMYWRALGAGGASKALDGPKALLPLMARTNFRAMYQLLTTQEQLDFQRIFTADKEWNDTPLVKGGYLGPKKAKETGPTRGEWIVSIVNGDPGIEPQDGDLEGRGPRGANYDKMSPPPGYPAHENQYRKFPWFTYAMGKFKVIHNGIIVLEKRNVSEFKLSMEIFGKRALDIAQEEGLQ